jgi:hypothetical protein
MLLYDGFQYSQPVLHFIRRDAEPHPRMGHLPLLGLGCEIQGLGGLRPHSRLAQRCTILQAKCITNLRHDCRDLGRFLAANAWLHGYFEIKSYTLEVNNTPASRKSRTSQRGDQPPPRSKEGLNRGVIARDSKKRWKTSSRSVLRYREHHNRSQA